MVRPGFGGFGSGTGAGKLNYGSGVCTFEYSFCPVVAQGATLFLPWIRY
jgi:hypothetical protein